jgi:adenylate kinase family enzyme
LILQKGEPLRIVVTGASGSGKTTLSGRLARLLGIPHVELDALHWGPNWTPAPKEAFREKAAFALSGDAWVSDGGYSALRDIVWTRANALVWLDYPLPLIVNRLVMRTLHRTVGRHELWNGNRESFVEAFFSRESLFLWAIRKHREYREHYPALLESVEFAHLRSIRFRHPFETERWIQESLESPH